MDASIVLSEAELVITKQALHLAVVQMQSGIEKALERCGNMPSFEDCCQLSQLITPQAALKRVLQRLP